MSVMKRIVCLANSRKLSGRCVAGIELIDGSGGGWIRPVSDREHEAVSEEERRYADGSDPRVLDVIDLNLLAPRPRGYQRENWLLDSNSNWKKVGRYAWTDLHGLAAPTGQLWSNGSSTYQGCNDRVPLEQAVPLEDSLRLIHVDTMTLRVFAPGEAFGNAKRRVQGRFSHRGTGYFLWVTDPVYEHKYLSRPDGDYELGECFMTVSLGEPHDGFCYKLIAAILEKEDR